MRLHRKASVLLLAGIGVMASACNWTTFASDADKAPVRSIKAPGGYRSQDFGTTLLALSDGQGEAAAFAASSNDDTELVVIKIDSGGGVSSVPIAATRLPSPATSPMTSLAEGSQSLSNRELLLGIPEVFDNTATGQIYALALPEGTATLKTSTAVGAAETGWGRGLATGHLTSATALDYVVGSDAHLAVLVGTSFGAATPATLAPAGAPGCDATFDAAGLDSRYRLRRPLVAARLWADPSGTAVQQLVTGSTHSTAAGIVSFYSVSWDGTTGSLNCLTTATESNKAHFGQSLATGDFDNDGNADLVVGAPSQQAFVYIGQGAPFPAGALPAPLTITDSTGVDFGYAVAALNIDNMPGDEVLIGDPRATVGGAAEAGRVVAYKFDAGTKTMKQIMTFSDHAPESGAKFGSTVSGLKFCTSASISPTTTCPDADTARILMVSGANEVFVYYQVGDKIPMRMRGGTMVRDVRAP